MVAYNFQAQFADDVASGRKRQTIRPNRKHNPEPGERLQLYTGQRTKACRKLCEPVCVQVSRVIIDQRMAISMVEIGGDAIVTQEELDTFVQADGFASHIEFLAFFRKQYGPHFEGVLIKW